MNSFLSKVAIENLRKAVRATCGLQVLRFLRLCSRNWLSNLHTLTTHSSTQSITARLRLIWKHTCCSNLSSLYRMCWLAHFERNMFIIIPPAKFFLMCTVSLALPMTSTRPPNRFSVLSLFDWIEARAIRVNLSVRLYRCFTETSTVHFS